MIFTISLTYPQYLIILINKDVVKVQLCKGWCENMIVANSSSKIQPILDLAYSLSFKDRLYLVAMVFRSFFRLSLKREMLSNAPEKNRRNNIQQSDTKSGDKVNRARADFWPEDESIDDFLDLIQEQRQTSLVS